MRQMKSRINLMLQCCLRLFQWSKYCGTGWMVNLISNPFQCGSKTIRYFSLLYWKFVNFSHLLFRQQLETDFVFAASLNLNRFTRKVTWKRKRKDRFWHKRLSTWKDVSILLMEFIVISQNLTHKEAPLQLCSHRTAKRCRERCEGR